ncbi:MAG: ATP-binding protein [Gaiellaceae bacterium]
MSSVEHREVHLTIPVAPEMEIAATAQVAALGEWMEMGRDKIDEVKMAVVEACINAFEHSATPDRKVELSFRAVGAEEGGRGAYLEVDVADSGHGFDPTRLKTPEIAAALRSSRKRGWGIKII